MSDRPSKQRRRQLRNEYDRRERDRAADRARTDDAAFALLLAAGQADELDVARRKAERDGIEFSDEVFARLRGFL